MPEGLLDMETTAFAQEQAGIVIENSSLPIYDEKAKEYSRLSIRLLERR